MSTKELLKTYLRTLGIEYTGRQTDANKLLHIGPIFKGFVLAHLEHPGGGVGGFVAAFSLCAALYASYTEVCRIGRREAQIATLQEKVRELMQSRRAAGLLRLEADVRRRRQDFPQPPFSGATAALARRRAGRRNPLRQVDYRRLCISSLEALVAEARQATAQGGGGQERGMRSGSGSKGTSAGRGPNRGGTRSCMRSCTCRSTISKNDTSWEKTSTAGCAWGLRGVGKSQ